MAICNLDLPAQVIGFTLSDPLQLAGELALAVANALRAAIAERGRATLVVSGGRSPVEFFKRLSAQPLDWSKVVVSLADERWVPVGHPDSNEGLVRRHLLQGEAAAARFIGIYHAEPSLAQAAARADQALAELPQPIDVLVLGMGEDGHTASLFPGSPRLAEALDPACAARCLPMLAPGVPHQRLSLTLPLLAGARLRLLALQGQGKLATLRDALAGGDAQQMPIRAFLNLPLELYWCP